MKDYKIGYIIQRREDQPIEDYNWLLDCYRNFINYIKDINENYDLELNIIEIEDYTKEECDLVIYEQSWLIYDILYDRSAFKNAKGNPKFLMYFFGEPHTCPYWYDDKEAENTDKTILRTLMNYVPFCSDYKCYAISMYEDTIHNCCMPYCIDTWSIGDVLYGKDILKNKKTKKNKFCSMVFSHGTKERNIIYNELNKYKQVDSYGRYSKNINNKEYYTQEDLNTILPKYKFNICFENTHSDYNELYITEKICNAFKWGSIPIYWGNNNQIYEIFNKKSFINLTDIPSNEWVDIIKEYDTNDVLYKQMLNENPIVDKNILNKYLNKKEKFTVKLLTKEY